MARFGNASQNLKRSPAADNEPISTTALEGETAEAESKGIVSDRTSSVVAIVMVILLVVFFFFTLNNIMVINERINSIRNGPYPVSIMAGRVETLLVQARTVSARAIYNHSNEALRSIADGYDEVNNSIEDYLDGMEENFSTDDQKADALKTAYESFRDQQTEFLAYCYQSGVTTEQIQNYYNDRIEPQIQSMLTMDQDILDDATTEVEETYETVTSASVTTMVVMCLLMVAVGVALAVYMILLYRKNERERELRANLEQAAAMANAANEAKSAFLSNMSHDIRTPMNAIVGLTTIARTHLNDTERVKSSLDRITSSSKHLLSLINDILDMSKIESGKITLNPEVFSLTKLVNEDIALLTSSARVKTIDFSLSRFTISHDLLIGDRMRVNQVLINLLSNAIKYTPDGGWVKLEVEEVGELPPSDETASPRSHIRFVVSDNGIGMDKDFQAKVFDPFERDYNEVTSFTEGTGLGLAITKRVIDLMGGTITVDSAPNLGSTFTVDLSLEVANADEILAYRRSESHDEAAPKSDTKLSGRVLLVEDNALNREIASELIGEMGIVVETARDGIEAVEMVDGSEEGYYSLIFMDWQMPRMDGLEATRTINAHLSSVGRAPIPIVAMTANAFNEQRTLALAAGMDGFMTKPIDLAELKTILRSYLSPRDN